MGLKAKVKRATRYVLSNMGRPVHVEIGIRRADEVLDGRTVLVTGGTTGIGYAIAEAVVRAGGSVVVTSRSAGRGEGVCGKLRELKGPGQIFSGELDLSNVDDMIQQYQRIRDGIVPLKIDALVNNAGILNVSNFGRVDESEWDSVMDTNLKGSFFLSQEVARDLMSTKTKGNIVFITSSSAYRPATNPYSCSKWALRGLVLGLSKMLAPHDIIVNAVAPGPTATPLLFEGAADNYSRPNSPIGRYVTPEEIASMVVTLLGDESRSIVGDTIRMTGGSGVVTFDDVTSDFDC